MQEEPCLLFLKAFWETICREWPGIDRLRLNKFYLLIKRFLLAAFEMIKANEWSESLVRGYLRILQQGPLHGSSKSYDGIRVVICENYVPLLRSLQVAFDAELTVTLLEPLMVTLSETNKVNLISALEEGIMAAVVNGDEDENNFKDDEEEDDDDEDEDEEDRLAEVEDEDCDSDQPAIFDCSLVGKRLFELGSAPKVSVKARKAMYGLSKTISNVF